MFMRKVKFVIFRAVALCGVSCVVSAGQQPTVPRTSPRRFDWNWRESQELTCEQSVRKAKIDAEEKRKIAAAIAAQLRSDTDDLEIDSEAQLQKAALDIRIKLIDLHDDGIPEVVAQSMELAVAQRETAYFGFLRRRKADTEYF
jgi:hypothetical protein